MPVVKPRDCLGCIRKQQIRPVRVLLDHHIIIFVRRVFGWPEAARPVGFKNDVPAPHMKCGHSLTPGVIPHHLHPVQNVDVKRQTRGGLDELRTGHMHVFTGDQKLLTQVFDQHRSPGC